MSLRKSGVEKAQSNKVVAKWVVAVIYILFIFPLAVYKPFVADTLFVVTVVMLVIVIFRKKGEKNEPDGKDGHLWVKNNKSQFDWPHDVDATVDDCVGNSAWRGWVSYSEDDSSDEI